MTRPLRLDTPDSWHHVMNHGIRDHPIFGSDRDRSLFLRCVVDATGPTRTAIAAFCLMGNHFHLVVHCPEGGLSEFMHRVTSRYARTFNRIHGYTGSLFRARFNSVLVQDDAQLVAVTRYVHRNPLELGQRIDTHPWSSYATYLGCWPRPWLSPQLVLRLAGGADSYRHIVEAAWPSDQFSVSDGTCSAAATPEREQSIQSISESVAWAATSDTSSTDRRAAAVLISLDEGSFSSSQIAEHVGMTSPSAVRSLAARSRLRLGRDQSFTSLVHRAQDALGAAAA